jgi:MYXO-CTERM domain-containing protein
MIVALTVAGSANAAIVAGTVDPFGNASSASSGVNSTYISSAASAVTGGLWDNRTVETLTTNNARATSSISVSNGSAVFAVTHVGAGGTANQKARLSNSASGGGTIGVRVFIAGSTPAYVNAYMVGTSGSVTINAADFGIDPTVAPAVPDLQIEIFRTGSSASGALTITNLVANGAAVPAPGALALLGAAGLVGMRRRR